MKITSNANQLSTEPQESTRLIDLRVWKVRNRITFREIGMALGGISGNAVQQMLAASRISTSRWEELKNFGVPEELLPPAVDVSRGRRKGV